ncbi:MAG: alpha-mannosidase, partial [Paracoccaceae bacterium]
ERVMRELEYLSAMAMILCPDRPYPTEKIDSFWEIILINQFHDILPGTSIAEVYQDSDNDYANLFSEMNSAQGPWRSAAAAITRPRPGVLTLFNFTGQSRDGDLVEIATTNINAKSLAMNGNVVPLQCLIGAKGESILAAPVRHLPSLGWSTAQLASVPAEPPQSDLSVSPRHIENASLRVTFDEAGEITSVIDKTQHRELIAAGKTANALIAYEDKPLNWDAWNIDRYFNEQFWPLADLPAKIEVVETGPYRAAIRIERTYASSAIVQVISLQAGARQLEFDTYVDWHERQTVLKVLFPFDLNTSEIRSEIQFGHVKRATHRNTSWDQAQFETSMQRWVDLSEADFGAALLNDCKYGYDAVEQLVRLTLLRGPIYPHPEADIGEHRFRYALKLHDGLSDLAHVVGAAERFNNPIAVVGDIDQVVDQPDTKSVSFSFAHVDTDSVTLETLKKAESGNDLILRVYEHANKRVKAKITFGVPIAAVYLVNLMENDPNPLVLEANSLMLDLRPFEIATLLIIPVA